MTEVLLHNKTDISDEDDTLDLSLHHAAQDGIQFSTFQLHNFDRFNYLIWKNILSTGVLFLLGDEKVVEVLLRGGANISAEDNNRYTPLHLASKNGKSYLEIKFCV